MARTTAALVGGIVELDATIDITPFIDFASELVTEVCEPVTTYTPIRLEMIERWLAAHAYKIRDQLVQSEQAGPVQASYGMKLGLGLHLTTYGQQAMILDTSGGLAALSQAIANGKIAKPSIHWLGTVVE